MERTGTSSRFVPVRRFSVQGLYHILTCTAKSSEKRVDYTETLYCKQSECPGWPDMDLWVTRLTVRGWSGRKGKGAEAKKQNEEKERNAIAFLILNGNTICPSLCLFSFTYVPFFFFSFISPFLGTRGGLNGDIVAAWEQHPDAVWVCKAELQHQWFCCQGEDYTCGNFLINVGAWMMMTDSMQLK